MNLAASGRTLFKPRSICLKLSTITPFTHARMFIWPDFPFSSSFIGKRDMLDMVSEEENVYYNANSVAGYCSGMSQITNIYDTHETPVQLWREYMLGGWG